jgi:DNA-binding NarL/FixJ family response regulator
MQRRVRLRAQVWRKRGHHVDFAAGVAVGYATLGKIGVDNRFDYGAIGTVVTVAAGLCEHANAGEILIDQRVRAALDVDIDAEPHGEITLSGSGSAFPAYRVAPDDRDSELERISEREQMVAALICQGASNKTIAAKLVIEEGTAANHVASILRKLGFTNRAQIAVWANEHGLGSQSDA